MYPAQIASSGSDPEKNSVELHLLIGIVGIGKYFKYCSWDKTENKKI